MMTTVATSANFALPGMGNPRFDRLAMRVRRTERRRERRANARGRKAIAYQDQMIHERGWCGPCSPNCGLS